MELHGEYPIEIPVRAHHQLRFGQNELNYSKQDEFPFEKSFIY